MRRYHARHQWVDANGLPWTPDAASDLCATCGHTPDVHPAPPRTLTAEQVDWIVARLPHRLDWIEHGSMPSDFRHLMTLLLDHVKATTDG